MLLSGPSQYPQQTHQQPQTQPRYTHILDYKSATACDPFATSTGSQPEPSRYTTALQSCLVPRSQTSVYNRSYSPATHRSSPPAADEACLADLSQLPDLMPSDPWSLSSQYAHKAFGRMPHQRESSLSSMGSAGPASPYSHAASNPHIAISDPASDGFGDMQHDGSSSYYQLAKAVGDNGGMFSGYHSLGHVDNPEMGYPATIALQRPRTDRINLLPAPDFGNTYNRSHPASVASSTVGGDSPATPTLGEPADEDRRRTRTTLAEPPKLDRTMTDIYSDELYNPSFTITSASPSHQQHLEISPSNELFAQRLSAANTQHLSASQSPTSTTSRDRSPFRHGSPLAPTAHDFGPVASSRLRFNSAHQIREHNKAAQDAIIMKQQMATKTETDTPKTISPKDAMLDFPGPDTDSVFPSLFPSQESTSDFGADNQMAKMSAPVDQLAIFSQSAPNEGYQYPAQQQMHSAIQIPQHYPFVAHARQSQPRITPNLSSAGSTDSSVSTPGQLTKPAGTNADGGTYTCTYHGCTLRFETPALLQKHKREGHRQPHGMGTVTRHPEVTSPVSPSFLNTQAGPHRCDRINPSTGKPCSTIFSRPYDLTRHEDTIHNARKQKVRCNLCTEEKTFSRADALTRHYRVCHPDVELPGKYRRRGNQG